MNTIKNLKVNKGITLITLVLIILVMLILTTIIIKEVQKRGETTIGTKNPGYKNIVVISHSWGSHAAVYKNNTWWQECGMAASVKENDYFSMLKSAITKVEPNANLSVVNVAEWERDFSKTNLIDNVLDNAVDLIIIRLGENVSAQNRSRYESELTTFVKYMKKLSPSAKFIFCTTGISSSEIANATINVANKEGAKVANAPFSSSNYDLQHLGNYVEGWYTEDEGITWDKNKIVLYPITYAPVARHPSDLGMLAVANSILTTAGYDTLNISYNIELKGSASYCPNKWVRGGIVSIHTSATNISVTTKDNTKINVINHNNGIFTFYMPSSDVTVTTF